MAALITTTNVWARLARPANPFFGVPLITVFPPVRTLLILALAHHGETGHPWMSIKMLAAKVGISESSAGKHLADMAERGWLLRIPKTPSRKHLHYALDVTTWGD